MNKELINTLTSAIEKKDITFKDDIAFSTFKNLLKLINYNNYPSLDEYKPSEKELEIISKGKSIVTPSELDIHNKCIDLSFKLDIIINTIIVFLEHNRIIVSEQIKELVETAINEAQIILDRLTKTYEQVEAIFTNYNAEISRITNNYRVLGAPIADKSIVQKEIDTFRQSFIQKRLNSFINEKSNK